jgi:outer membrane protein OmpA-like peptidoglycan-associated protein
MPDPSANSPSSPDTEEVSSPEEKAFQELRDLLLGAEKQELSTLRERLQNPDLRTQDISAVIAEALRLRREQGGDSALREALGPSVESVVRESVRRDSGVLAEALFPIMGPAIRKSIAESIRSMLQSFNEALAHSLSIQGVKWRLEALRTGRPFAEIVLLHGLVYRVEQIFLIHKKSGLLLQHVVAPQVEMQDPDMVSGMLSAIQDFVRDSFNSPQGETLDTLQVGDLHVWVEHGPKATLAAVVRGHAPESLRLMMKERLEEAHRRFATELEEFEGNAAPFEALREGLMQCLGARYKEDQHAKSPPYVWVAGGLLLVLIGTWMALAAVQSHRWNGFAADLRRQPGIVITSFTKEGGRYLVRGLRDPLAVRPSALLEELHLDPRRVEFQLRPYNSGDDAMILKRAEGILRPPAGVALTVKDGILHPSGNSPPGWGKRMREVAPLIAGVAGIDESALNDADSLAHLKAALESAILLYSPGDASLAADQRERLDGIVPEVQAVVNGAQSLSSEMVVEVVGHADTTGPDTLNSRLSAQRASEVVNALVQKGIHPRFLRARGAGTSEPVRPETTEDERRYNRSVTFRVSAPNPTAEK